jgi:prevent-host-death family protein
LQGAGALIDGVRKCGHNDYMERDLVGARELKARLGTYLRRVRQGRTLVVTDRGEPVAELRPLPASTSAEAVLAKLKAAGTITRIADRPLRPFQPITSRGRSAAAAVLEDREDRF